MRTLNVKKVNMNWYCRYLQHPRLVPNSAGIQRRSDARLRRHWFRDEKVAGKLQRILVHLYIGRDDAARVDHVHPGFPVVPVLHAVGKLNVK